ncbi:hypothetical protein EBT16_10705 [bacterium]|nr:hypothetical protein [bacterium]
MKFKFRLEKAAQFFSRRETAKKLELAALTEKMLGLKKELEVFEDENRSVFSKNSQFQTVAAPWIRVLMERVDSNLLSIKQIQTEIEHLLGLMDMKKQELSAISKRKKALEKVKEKKFAEFKLKQSRSEQKRLDENYQILELIKE